ncbi:MAG TPA: response regulator [Candidatus Methylomirabilis sp.]|nr:response regulator [Candidatus Methylomirabilis sp.]
MSGETLAGGSRQTILCIDDDRLVLGVCTIALEAHGYRVLFTTDPATGLAIAREERPDVILLDVLMPAMTGLEVCQQLRADPNLKDTPIILLTALEDAGVGSMGEKAGATLTLRKPFAPESIVETVERVLGGKPSPGTL